jgi:hypothetical protein
MNSDMKRLIEVANELAEDGSTYGSTGEQIGAAFILNDMALLPAQYTDVLYAWQRLNGEWQGYVNAIKSDHMDRIHLTCR